jgi:ABC-type multidrug transport system fused ATPase/permease subunit
VAAGLAITWRAGRRELITMAVLELLSGVGVAVEVIVGRRALEAILVTGAVRHRGGGGGDVQLSGSQRVALRDVSLHISPGEVVALVGANGSGKTTLAKVLAGLYLPSRGRVCWDGRDTREVDSRELLSHTAIVFQDFIRYALPAGDNIALGPAFIDGTDLPTGQWQRVALARTFFRDAPLVILDEPTAALDAKAEHELFGRIGELFADRSVLLISHRSRRCGPRTGSTC